MFIQQTFIDLLGASSYAGHWVYNKQNWFLPLWNAQSNREFGITQIVGVSLKHVLVRVFIL